MQTELDTHRTLPSGKDTIEDKIVEQIFEAVIDQRLPPGTKLLESSLCEAFTTSRMRIRRALLLLASMDVVDIVSNRGAYVASPSASQARDVFETRMAIEPNIARYAVRRATQKDILALEKHIEKECIAHNSENRQAAIRLSGLFHVILAQIANNGVMLRMVKELITRSSLIISIFGAPGVVSCRNDDHAEILAVFKAGDEDLAAQLVSQHLEYIQTFIDLESEARTPINLVGLLNTTSDKII